MGGWGDRACFVGSSPEVSTVPQGIVPLVLLGLLIDGTSHHIKIEKGANWS